MAALPQEPAAARPSGDFLAQRTLPPSGGTGRHLPMIRMIRAGTPILSFLAMEQYAAALLHCLQTIGAWGPLVFGAVYVLATVLMVPGGILGIVAGFAFGVVAGTVTVSLASTLGATLAFLLGRTLARRLVQARIARRRSLRALDEAIGRKGFLIVLLTRLSPILPYNLLNYGYGLTRVHVRTYVLASWIGMLPGTVTYVYAGSVMKSVAEVAAGRVPPSPAQGVLSGVGLAATIAVVILMGRIAKKALGEAEANQPSCSLQRRNRMSRQPPRSAILGVAIVVLVAAAAVSAETGKQEKAASQLDRLLIQAQKICPVTGKDLNSMGGPVKAEAGGMTIFLCCKGCLGKPIQKEAWAKIQANVMAAQKLCPVRNVPLGEEAISVVVDKRLVFVCCGKGPCAAKVKGDPKKYIPLVDAMLKENLAEKN